MAVLNILTYPDKRLREKALPVESVTPDIQKLIDDMAETMYAAPGVGLAATQVGVLLRIFVVDCASDNEPSQFKAFVNPEILQKEGSVVWREGCLSFPGVSEDVDRFDKVRVRALDREGRPFELEADGLLAIAIQHETEHLDGELMIDHLGPVRKRLVQRKFQRAATQHARP